MSVRQQISLFITDSLLLKDLKFPRKRKFVGETITK